MINTSFYVQTYPTIYTSTLFVRSKDYYRIHVNKRIVHRDIWGKVISIRQKR